MRSTTPVTQKNEICAEFPSGGQKSNSGHGRATTDRLIAFKRNDGPKANTGQAVPVGITTGVGELGAVFGCLSHFKCRLNLRQHLVRNQWGRSSLVKVP
jgi:hypothetical protein